MAYLDKKPEDLRRGELATLRYDQARVDLTNKDVEGARDIWNELAHGDDRRTAVRAEYALINLGLKQGDLTVDEAVKRLEKLRFKWRGDDFELGVLRRLGELHIANNDYMSGLEIMRMAVTYFPNKRKRRNWQSGWWISSAVSIWTARPTSYRLCAPWLFMTNSVS